MENDDKTSKSPIEEAMKLTSHPGKAASKAYEARVDDGNQLIVAIFEAFATLGPKQILRYFERETGAVWMFAMHEDLHSTEYVLTLPHYELWRYDDTWAILAGNTRPRELPFDALI